MISVIIVSFNTADLLKKCLTALFETTAGMALEVFVVDNASRDNSVEMVRQAFPQVELIENRQNRGFAAANNQAWQRSRGDYVLLLNPDAFVKSRAVTNAVAFMQAHPGCGLCGGRLVKPDGSLDPSARRFPNAINKLFTISGLRSRFPNSQLFSHHEFGNFDHKQTLEVDWVPGTFTLYRREMLLQTGLFDERYFVYYEETDLCRSAKKLGWQVCFIPDAEVIHVGGACSKTLKEHSYDRAASQVLTFRLRSEWLYFRKNNGLGAVLANAGVEVGWHLVRCLINLLPGRRDGGHKAAASQAMIREIGRSLRDTRLGLLSPPAPW